MFQHEHLSSRLISAALEALREFSGGLKLNTKAYIVLKLFQKQMQQNEQLTQGESYFFCLMYGRQRHAYSYLILILCIKRKQRSIYF